MNVEREGREVRARRSLRALQIPLQRAYLPPASGLPPTCPPSLLPHMLSWLQLPLISLSLLPSIQVWWRGWWVCGAWRKGWEGKARIERDLSTFIRGIILMRNRLNFCEYIYKFYSNTSDNKNWTLVIITRLIGKHHFCTFHAKQWKIDSIIIHQTGYYFDN